MKFICLLYALLFAGNAMAEGPQVSGTITDSQTGDTIIGAHVTFLDEGKKARKDSTYGAVTDADGKYSIQSVPEWAKYIQVSYIGYKPEIMSLTDSSVYNIKLTEDDQALDEVTASATNREGKPCADDLLEQLNATAGIYAKRNDNKGNGKLYCKITQCKQYFERKNQEQVVKYKVDGEESTQTQYMTCSCKYETGDNGTCMPPQPEKVEPAPVVATPIETDPRWSEKEIDAARDAAESARETENSDVNKMLGATGMGATGIGGMMLMQGLAEKAADDDATRAMQAYIATFNCEVGNNRVPGGATTEVPGGNELINLYGEYVNLANNVKEMKSELGLRPGIESEPILNSATSGLYDDVSVAGTSGAYASLARALMDPYGKDAAAWAEQTEKTSKNITTGAITAGTGTGVSLIGDLTNKAVEKKKAEKSEK